MTKQDIKKEYQKMSRQLKKAGLNYTCVMNKKQQELGTATICFFAQYDYERRIRRAEEELADETGTMKDAKRAANELGKNINSLRRWAAEKSSSNSQLWTDIVEAYDNGTLVEKEYQKIEERKQQSLECAKEEFKKNGTWEEQQERGMKRLEELKEAEPIKAFCKKTESNIRLECKEENKMIFWYLRFFYKAE